MPNCTFPGCKERAVENKKGCIFHGRHFGEKTEKKKHKQIKKVSNKKKSKFAEEKERKDRLTQFYNDQLNAMPHNCMNCQDDLFKSQAINPRTPIAHILPKSKFPEIETNTDNVLYLCKLCHGRLDHNTEKFMQSSHLAPLIRQRVQVLLPLIEPNNLKSVSEFLL